MANTLGNSRTPKSPTTLTGRWEVGKAKVGRHNPVSQHQCHPHKPGAGSRHTRAPASQSTFMEIEHG